LNLPSIATNLQIESWHSLVFRQTPALRAAPDVQRCITACYVTPRAALRISSLTDWSLFLSSRDDVRNRSCLHEGKARGVVTNPHSLGRERCKVHTKCTWVERHGTSLVAITVETEYVRRNGEHANIRALNLYTSKFNPIYN
jgi:hypothetical protein